MNTTYKFTGNAGAYLN